MPFHNKMKNLFESNIISFRKSPKEEQINFNRNDSIKEILQPEMPYYQPTTETSEQVFCTESNWFASTMPEGINYKIFDKGSRAIESISNYVFELKSKLKELEATIAIFKDDKENLENQVINLEKEIITKKKNYMNTLDHLKDKTLTRSIDQRNIIKTNILLTNKDIKINNEKKIELLEAEIEFIKKQNQIIENEAISKYKILSNDLNYHKGESEKLLSENINLKVKIANLSFDHESELITIHTTVKKMKLYIKNQNILIAKLKKI